MKTQTIRTREISKEETQFLLHKLAETLDDNQALPQMIGQLRRYE